MMGIPVMVLGKSGSGKTTSLRNMNPDTTLLIQTIRKPLPFKSSNWKMWGKDNPKGSIAVTDDYKTVHTCLNAAVQSGKTSIIIDDSNYLMTNSSLRKSDETGFKKFVEFAKSHWELVNHAQNLPGDVRVYFMSHIQVDEDGNKKPMTIGKMLDQQICLEGLFAIVIGCHVFNSNYLFATQNGGSDVIKTPMGMFSEDEIDNDLNIVDSKICDYYGISNEQTDNA